MIFSRDVLKVSLSRKNECFLLNAIKKKKNQKGKNALIRTEKRVHSPFFTFIHSLAVFDNLNNHMVLPPFTHAFYLVSQRFHSCRKSCHSPPLYLNPPSNHFPPEIRGLHFSTSQHSHTLPPGAKTKKKQIRAKQTSQKNFIKKPYSTAYESASRSFLRNFQKKKRLNF